MMNLNIRELSDPFSENLPQGQNAIQLSDIETSGIPFPVRKRIAQITQDKFSRSLGEKRSEWVDFEVPGARDAWNRYLRQMTDYLMIPAEKVDAVIYEAVEFTLQLAIQPRRTIIDILFKHNDRVSKEDLDSKMDQFVLNRHLVYALSRYMEKKKRDSLDIDEARTILKKVDEKLTDSFHAMEWMEAVKPIFYVVGSMVPSDYIRLFFEEKEMPRVARKFDLMEREISDTDFVEVMSSAELLDLLGYEEEQPALFTSEDLDVNEADEEESIEADTESSDGDRDKSSESDFFKDMNEVDLDDSIKSEFVGEQKKSPVEEKGQEPQLFEQFSEDDKPDEEKPKEVSESSEDANEYVEHSGTQEGDESEEERVVSETMFVETDDVRREDIDEPSVKLQDEGYVDLPEPEEKKRDAEQEGDDELTEEQELRDADSSMNEDRVTEDELPDKRDYASDADVEIEQGSLIERFMGDDESDNKFKSDFERDERRSKSTSIYGELNLSQVEESDSDEDLFENDDAELNEEHADTEGDVEVPFEPNDRYDEEIGSREDRTEIQSEEGTEPSEPEKDEDVPMWKSFLEREDPDDEPSFYFDESSEEKQGEEASYYEDDEFENDFVLPYAGDRSHDNADDEVEHLLKWLKTDTDRFIHSVFNGSSLAWEQALIDLTVFDDWKSASKYLENEIFNKNRIDIYSEVAVDFTDYLHSYFMKYKS